MKNYRFTKNLKLKITVCFCLIFLVFVSGLIAEINFEDDEKMQEVSKHFKAGESELGLEKLNKYIEEDPQYINALYLRASWYVLTSDDMKRVFEDLKVIAQQQEDPAKLYEDMSYLCIANGRYENARKLLDYALPLYPKSYRLKLNNGYWYEDNDKFDKAIANYRQVLKMNPEFTKVLTSIVATIKKAIKKSEGNCKSQADYYEQLAYVYNELEQGEKMQNAAYKAKALGEDSAYNELPLPNRDDPAYVVQFDSFPYPKGGLFGYRVNSATDYDFAIEISEKSPKKLSFFWQMSTADDMYGAVVMDSTALNYANKLFNYFKAGEKSMLTDRTSVWVSKDVYNALKKNESVAINTGYGFRNFQVTGTQPNWFVSNGVSVEVNVLRAESQEKTVGSDDNKESEVLLILDDPNNPLIIGMYLTWDILLKKVSLSQELSLQQFLADM